MSLLIFLGVLSILVVVHEWGHFAFARLFKIPVQRFSIGFGPQIFKKKLGETEFCVSIIPFGGYVKLQGEEATRETPGALASQGSPDDFVSRPAYQKALVIFAGPLLNAILAFLLFTGIYIAGHPAYSTVVGGVLDGYPAQAAGLQAGDRILSMNGKELKLWEDLLAALQESRGPITLDVDRAGERKSLEIQPKVEEAQTLIGKKIKTGRIGVLPSEDVVYVKFPVIESVKLGFQKVVFLTRIILASLGAIITGQLSVKESLTGPIGIYFMTEQAATVGIIHLLYFTASLSVSLWVMNLLPIPVLDGGHLFFIILETIIRRPISDKFKERCTQVGLYLLLAVAALVIYQDLVKYGIIDRIRALPGLLGIKK